MKKLFLSMALVMSMGLLMTSCGDDEKEPDPQPCEGTDCDTTVVDTPAPKKYISGEIGTSTTWSNDTIYIMTSKVWINNGATLKIEEGTVIKARKQTNPNDAVALIVTAGSKIMAVGTSANPIIFTSEEDALEVINGSVVTESNLNENSTGLWGGVVLIGKATVDIKDEIGGQLIEGVASNEERGRYGANTNTTSIDTDNSGTLKYVSIRHGGASVTADSELNGLSLYGVGSGTTIDYIEIFANNDDGIEFFGGVPTVTHAIVVNCSDDGFDYDQGFSGKGQYWAVISSGSDKGGEFDGGEGDRSPNSVPTIANFTMIGTGTVSGLHMKSSAGGKLYNGIIYNYETGINAQSIIASDVVLEGIAIQQVSTTSAIISDSDDNSDLTATYPGVTSQTFSSISAKDLIPSQAEAATTVANPSTLNATTYKGAFDPSSSTTWAANWTRTWELNLID